MEMIEKVVERVNEVFLNRFELEILVHPMSYCSSWELSSHQLQKSQTSLIYNDETHQWVYFISGMYQPICIVEILGLSNPSDSIQEQMALFLATSLESLIQDLERWDYSKDPEIKNSEIVNISSFCQFQELFESIGTIPKTSQPRKVLKHILLTENESLKNLKIAHEIHKMSRRWAFMRVDSSFFDVQNTDEIKSMGSAVIYVSDFHKLDFEGQARIHKMIDWTPSQELPLFIFEVPENSDCSDILNHLSKRNYISYKDRELDDSMYDLKEQKRILQKLSLKILVEANSGPEEIEDLPIHNHLALV